jgi:hypothetical protein
MDIYSTLFDSMIVDCLERMGIRQGLIYTAAMMALSLGFCLNLLSVMDLLWKSRNLIITPAWAT